MKTSERLRRKIKREFSQIKYVDEMVFTRVNGYPDGARFTWFAEVPPFTYPDAEPIYSYDTMTECLKEPLGAIYNDGSTNAPEGWLVGVN
mgnify:CR=1 FL=1